MTDVAKQDERTQAVIKAVRDLYLSLPKSEFARPRFQELWRALNCLDGPLFVDEERKWCEKREAT